MTRASLEAWRKLAPPMSRWRRAARAAIRRVVDGQGDFLATIAPSVGSSGLIALVDAAYPFGQRAMLPYKMWLVERQLFIEALERAPAAPTADEAAACMVARDRIEAYDEPEAEMVAWLDVHAPNRLARKCPACGARAGRPCWHADAEAPGTSFLAKAAREFLKYSPLCFHCGRHVEEHHGDRRICPPALSRELIVPHETRLTGHLDAGPLFAGAR